MTAVSIKQSLWRSSAQCGRPDLQGRQIEIDRTQPMNARSDPQVLLHGAAKLDVDWYSLLNTVGTAEFEQVLAELLSRIVGPGACIALCDLSNEALDAPGRQLNTIVSIRREASADQLHWIHFDGGIAVALPEPLHWASILELSRRIAGTGGLLSAIMLHHLRRFNHAEKRSDPFRSVLEIQKCIADSTDLPPREIEVCSRVLYGMFTAGIALDLDISESTIKTYRKRAYQRLMIGSERELTMWYLRTWHEWKGSKPNVETAFDSGAHAFRADAA